MNKLKMLWLEYCKARYSISKDPYWKQEINKAYGESNMKRIYKYTIRGFADQIEMPAGAEIIQVAVQHGEINLWAIVDDWQPSELRKFIVIATGSSIDEKWKFLGTVFEAGGHLVWHVFEI